MEDIQSTAAATSEQQRSAQPAGSRAWRAFREGLVATVLAMAVTFLVYLSGLSYSGADLSQRILLGLGQSPLSYVHHSGTKEPASWILLDIELAECRDPDGCGGSRFRPEVLVGLLQRVRAAGPRVIVLDVLTAGGLTDKREVAAPLLAQLNTPGPPTLLAWAPKSSWYDGATGTVALSELDAILLGATGTNRARYLPAAIEGRPTARLLTPTICAQAADGAAHTIPTIGYAAALIASEPGTGYAALNRVYQMVDPTGCSRGASSDLRQWARTERVFSAGSLFERNAPGEARFWPTAGHWLHFTVAADPAADLPSAAALKDAVVLVGSADPDSEDVHWTSTGDLAGSEIVLNDMRQYLSGTAAPQPPPWRKTLKEWPFFLAGFLAVILAHLFLPHHRALLADGKPRLLDYPAVRVPLNFTIAIGLTFLFFIGVLIVMSGHLGSPPDFVTPFIALSAEAIVEVLYHFIALLRKLLHLDNHGQEP